MDPISVAGGVFGVLSLGIQIENWATTYVDGVKCQQQDIESARSQLRCMEEGLRSILTTIGGSGFLDRLDDDMMAVCKCVEACKVEIKALETLLFELTGTGENGRDTTRMGLMRRLKEQKKRLAYPYKRDNLLRLEGRLGRVNGVLGVTLTTVNIRLGIQASTDIHAQNVTLLQDRVTLSEIRDMLIDLRQKLPSHPPLKHLVQGNEQGEVVADLNRLVLKTLAESGYEVEHAIQQTQKQLISKTGRPFEPYNALRLTTFFTEVNPHGSYKTVPQTPRISNCTCKPRRQVRRAITTLSVFHLQTEIRGRHDRSCPAAEITSHTPSIFTTISCTLFLKALINYAIYLSVSFSSGAAGASLSPSIRTLRLVDDRVAPAFVLLRSLTLGPTGIDITIPEIRDKAMEGLYHLFRTGQASPFDIGADDGETLMEVLPFFRSDSGLLSVLKAPDDEISGPLEVISKLNAWGVPSNQGSDLRIRRKNILPVVAMMTLNGRPSSAMMRITELLYSLDYPLQPSIPTEMIITKSFLAFISRCREFSEDIESGPLSYAIASLDGQRMAKTLQASRVSLKEKNIYGHTPFHLATPFPDGLELLIQAAQQEGCSVEMINRTDRARLTPLQHVILASKKDQLVELDMFDCLQEICPRARSIELLLETDCRLSAYDVELLGGFLPCCSVVPSLLIQYLTQRRNRLKAVALENFPEDGQARLGLLHGSVLDSRTDEVIEQLEKYNIVVVDALRTGTSEKKGYLKGRSLYHLISQFTLAEGLYESGFRETNLSDSRGWTPVAQVISHERCKLEDVEYLAWLLAHGAMLESPAFESAELARNLAFKLGALEGGGERLPKGLLGIALRDLSVDCCRCACSEKGCTAATKFMNGLWSEIVDDEISDTAPPASWVVQNARNICQSGSGPPGFVDVLAACLRSFLFVVLDLRHTCCSNQSHPQHCLKSSASADLDEDELDELRVEDREGIQELERSLAKFVDFLSVYQQEEGDLYDMTIQGSCISTRMTEWIQVAVGKLQSRCLNAKNIQSGREVGIVWEENDLRDTSLNGSEFGNETQNEKVLRTKAVIDQIVKGEF